MKKLFLVLVILLPLVLFIKAITTKDEDSQLWQGLETEGDRAFQLYEIKEARRYWQSSLKENPDNLKVYNKLGISFMLLKEYDKAVGVLREGLKINSNSPSLNYNLALAYYYSGDVKYALKGAEKVLSLNIDYPEANYLRGLCFEKMGRIEDARAAYVEELNSNPGSRRAWQKVRAEL